MAISSIEWEKPWRVLQIKEEASKVQSRFEHEITAKHPLHGKGATAVGCRVDNDDVLVLLNDGTYANVHLVWGSGPEPFPEQYPSWFLYGSLSAFVQEMHEDAIEYGSET